MNIHVLQHHPAEGPGLIALWAQARQYPLHLHAIQAGFDFTALPMADLLVVLGGPMSVNQNDAWLAQERDYIQAHWAQRRPMVGICLGAQQMAKVLGAEVDAGTHREAGWYPIQAAATAPAWFPPLMTVLHWHGEVFALPKGAQRLCYSEITPNQGFLYPQRVLALQCHLEVTSADVAKLVAADGDYLNGGCHTQTAEQVLQYAPPAQNQLVMNRLLDELVQQPAA